MINNNVVAGKIDSSHFNRQWPEALHAGNHADLINLEIAQKHTMH